MQIICVEDDAVNAKILVKFLAHYNCQVFTTGEDAIEHCRDNEADLILMDINLGSDCLDGIQTMKVIKGLEYYKTTPILAVTAYAMPEDRQRFLDVGFDEYFSKPIDREILVDSLQKYEKN